MKLIDSSLELWILCDIIFKYLLFLSCYCYREVDW